MCDEVSLLLSEDLVFINLRADKPETIIRMMGERMREKGLVKDSFLAAALAREKKFPTALPTPIPVSFPHTDVKHCLQPAISIAVLEQPVEFGFMGDPSVQIAVKVVFMLSVTQPQYQVKTLQKLIDFCQSEENLRSIIQSEKPSEVIAALQGLLDQKKSAPAENPGLSINDSSAKVELTIQHPAGMHARPASLFVKAASQFPCDIFLSRADQPNKTINAKSILSLLGLGIRQGEKIVIETKGPKHREAIEALAKLIEENFAEGNEIS